MTAPIRLFDQDHTLPGTPRFPPSGAVDYPLPDQRQRGLSINLFCELKSQAEIDAELPRYANLRTGGNMPSDAQWVTPVFWGCIALVVAALAAGWWLT